MPTLTVNITHKRNTRGQFILVVYDSPAKWLDDDADAPAKTIKQSIAEGDTLRVQLPDGTYGFILLHDENMNDELDRGILLPKEGLAASNDAKMTLKGPKWQDAKFVLSADRSMSVGLKYWG